MLHITYITFWLKFGVCFIVHYIVYFVFVLCKTRYFLCLLFVHLYLQLNLLLTVKQGNASNYEHT